MPGHEVEAELAEALRSSPRPAPAPGRTGRAARRARRVQKTTGRSPPGPFRCGSTTCSAKPAATAASNALPPRSSIAMPAAEASQWVEATIPKVPRSSGRVVKLSGLPLLPARPAPRRARRLGPARARGGRPRGALAGDVDAAAAPRSSSAAPTRAPAGSASGTGSPTADRSGSGPRPRARRGAGALRPGSGTTAAESSACVYGCCGRAKSSSRRRQLDELPEVHHRDPIAEELDGRKIVA